MRLSAVLQSPHWLASLKATQLQRIARATGIQSSGTKSILVERIASELRLQSAKSDAERTSFPSIDPSHRHGDCGYTNNSSGTSPNSSVGGENSSVKHSQTKINPEKPWSILSIDMGIQNLAFAHLRLADNPSRPVLTAWHRLAVSEISSLNLAGGNVDPNPSQVKDDQPETLVKRSSKRSKPKETESFSPDLYAATAYNLITSLLTAYRPTHILIERQRFRSGGASAVQEWTLRVGVFEGMLYAILHALQKERGDIMIVKGIEPKRVARYWLEATQKEKEKEKLNAREVKKAKIDIVGKWISAARDETTNPMTGSEREGKILLADGSESPVLQGIVTAYEQKWQGKSKPRKVARSKKSMSALCHGESSVQDVDIGKLDDLADCLLQGVAWVEWQAMRERIAKEGPEILDGL